ncbi:MAG: hypothetical protein AAFU60_18945 [Bacteroidota bacterium]
MSSDWKHIDLAYLHTMIGEDQETKKAILDLIISELPTEVAFIQQAADKEDWFSISKACHKLISTLSFVGNRQLEQWINELHGMSKNPDHSGGIPQVLANIQQMVPLVLAEMEEIRATL